MTELTQHEKDTIVAVIGAYDKEAILHYIAGNSKYVPAISDSLEMSDMELEIEERLGWDTVCFSAWDNLKVGATIEEILNTATTIKADVKT